MKKLILLLVLSATYISCTSDDVKTYDNSPYIVGFTKASDVRSYVATGDIVPLDVPITLIGGQQGQTVGNDVTMTYTLADASTAVEGDEFDFVNATSEVVLAQGVTSTSIPLVINTGNLETGAENAKTIVLDITTVVSDESVVIGTQYSRITITLNGLCYSHLQAIYNLTATRVETGATYALPGEEIFELSPGTYLTSSTGPYNARGLISAGAQLASSTPGFVFSEVCNVITLQTQQLAGVYSNIVTQSSAQAANSFKAENGDLTIEYSVWFTGNTVERPYRGVYIHP